MEQVKQMVEGGVTLSTAIKEALGKSLSAWADEHGLSRPIVSDVLNLERSPRLEVCRALSTTLGGTPFEWALELWRAARPKAESFAA